MLISRQRGVSLIETMMAVVIMVVLVVMGLPSFSAFLQNRKVRNATEAIHNGLSLAKAEAVRRNTIVAFNLSANRSWSLTCTNCADTLPSMPATEIPAEIAISTSATPLVLNFNGFGKVTSLSDGSTSVINISNSNGTCEKDGGSIRCLRIIVAPGGQIRSCDPRLTDTNPSSPQAC
ncbi:GspH/FimT family pseudopilin [Rhodoferax sp. GW822-FHT02A01]|uniref:GspH/FimT family pseudopilin n=1 Tax=Rhodoferax sp. GW822-FHT02A01 TaxID=3141537 RepID=UPI00315D6FF7